MIPGIPYRFCLLLDSKAKNSNIQRASQKIGKATLPEEAKNTQEHIHRMESRTSPSVSVSLFLFSVLVLTLSVYGSNSLKPSEAPGAYVSADFRTLSGLDSGDFRSAMESMVAADHVASFYRNPDTRAAVIIFFEGLTGNYEIARAILDESIERGISPAFAFALVYEESAFDPKAFNRNADSIDRGLFQLNSLSFPSLSVDEFYDIGSNVRNGIRHLSFCLKSGGNEVAALAMYNAGLSRVSKGGTPRRTLDYIYRITGYRDRLEALFEAQVVAKHSKTGSIAIAPALVDPLD